jgi:chemotaxis signal transduction protein
VLGDLFMTPEISSPQLGSSLAVSDLGFLVLQFKVADQVYAIRADCVERVLPLAAWTAKPGLPNHVVGLLNLKGEIFPVVDARACLGLATKLPETADHLLLVRLGSLFFIWIDRATAVLVWNETDSLINLEVFKSTGYV